MDNGNGNQIGTWVVVAIVVIAGGWWLISNGSNTSNISSAAPIKIGLIAPLTGSLAFIGEAGKNGAQLAMDKINANPALKHTYQLMVEDDSFDATKTASAANKLISVDNVDTLISVGSGPGNVAAPIAEQDKIPHICMASDPSVAKGDYNFIDWTQPQQETTALVAELQRRHLSKVAVIGVNQQGYNAILDDFKKKIVGTGIIIVSDSLYNPGTTDFKTILSKAQASNPDVYYLGSFDPETGILGKQIKQLGITQPVTSIESFGITADPSEFEGQWFIDSAEPTSGFGDEYQKTFGKAVGPTAANVYDSILLFVKAAEMSKSTGAALRADIAANLLKINDYSGALGPMTVTPEGIFQSQASVKIIKDGKAVLSTN